MSRATSLRNRRISMQMTVLLASIAGVVGVRATFLIYPYFFCPASPGAVAACPIWMIEHGVLESHRGAGAVFALIGYLLGVILLLGALFGRGSCGWACPVGFLQDGLKHLRSTPLKRMKPHYLAVLSLAFILPTLLYSSMALGYLATFGFYMLIGLAIHQGIRRRKFWASLLLTISGVALIALSALLRAGVVEAYQTSPRPLAFFTSVEFTGFTGLLAALPGAAALFLTYWRRRAGRDPFTLKMGGKERIARPIKYGILLSIAPLSYVTGTLAFTDVDPIGGLVATLPTLFYQPELWRGNPTFFWIKAANTGLFMALAVTVYRGWCRYLCPLGALWSPMNKISLLRIEFEPKRCINCGLCVRACPMGLDPRVQVMSPECIVCSKCVEVCPTEALVLKFAGRKLSERPLRSVARGDEG